MIKKKQLNSFYNKKLQPKLRMLLNKISSIDRSKIIFTLFVIYAFVIIITSFKYSVLEVKYYSKLAEGQQTKIVKNTVNRWTIYSNNSPVWVLATSTDLSDLAVDPVQEWSKEKLEAFLTDIVYTELCTGSQADSCEDNLLAFIKAQELEDLSNEINYVKDKIHKEVKKRLDKKYMDFALIKQNLTKEEVEKITYLWNEAISINNNSLYFDFSINTDKNELIIKLNNILNIWIDKLKTILTQKEIRYIKFITKLNLTTKDKIDARIESEKNAINKWLLEESQWINKFIILEPHPTRFFPEKTLASQILWFVDNEWQWRYWIEGYYNDELRWQEGVKITKKDISGKAIGLYELSEQKLVAWSDIKLTIDRNIQKEVWIILEKWIKSFKANKWSVVVMDPKTWAIIAMVSYPDYDPNNFGEVYELEKVNYSKYPNPWFDLLGMPVFVEDSWSGTDLLKYDGRMIKLRLANERELSNRVIPKFKFKNNLWPGSYINDTIWSLYEPWSVFKAITTAIWIETGMIKPSDRYTDKWFVNIDEYKISNVSKECIWYNTYSHALDWSCNVWMIDIVKKIWSSLFFKYINDFWFWSKTNITLEWEVYGKIQPYEKWSKAKLFTQSFWQWITATVLQMAVAYSIIANWWIYMQPYIVDTIILPNWQVNKNIPTPIRRVITEETSKTLIAMLTEWANIWFAKKWWVEWYDMAGKTGTSQIAAKWKYEVDWPGHTVTSYWWFWPSSNPKFVMIVKIERPRTAEYSETTSSAMYSEIAKYLLNYYAIPKSK